MKETLNDLIERMKLYNEKGYDVFIEGQGDGTVKAVAEAIFIVDNRKIKNKKE